MTPDADALTRRVDAAVEAHAFSGVIDIRHGGDLVYARAAGHADRGNELANRLDTRFGIASGTKFLTALAIGKLIEAGKLSLTTRLKDCLAVEFPRHAPEINIQHLLTHTSGIPDYYDEEKVKDSEQFTVSVPWYELRGPRDYLAVFPDEEMMFAPGERFAYSNGGYILLGVVIEELAGMPYQQFVEEAIFQAIGMRRSGFFALNRLPGNTALGYVEAAGDWRTNVYHLPIVGASDGGAFTTVQDVATLWSAFWGNRILAKELVDLYSAPHVDAPSEGAGIQYGHGLWMRDRAERGRQVYILGGDPGVSFWSGVERDSDADFLVTVISNTTHGAWPIVKEIDATLCPGA